MNEVHEVFWSDRETQVGPFSEKSVCVNSDITGGKERFDFSLGQVMFEGEPFKTQLAWLPRCCSLFDHERQSR